MRANLRFILLGCLGGLIYLLLLAVNELVQFRFLSPLGKYVLSGSSQNGTSLSSRTSLNCNRSLSVITTCITSKDLLDDLDLAFVIVGNNCELPSKWRGCSIRLRSADPFSSFAATLQLVRDVAESDPFNSSYLFVERNLEHSINGFAGFKILNLLKTKNLACSAKDEIPVNWRIVDKEGRSHVQFINEKSLIYSQSFAAPREIFLNPLLYKNKYDTIENLCVENDEICRLFVNRKNKAISLSQMVSSMSSKSFQATTKSVVISNYRFPAPHFYVHLPKTGSSFMNVILSHSCKNRLPHNMPLLEPYALSNAKYANWYEQNCRKEIRFCSGHRWVERENWNIYKGHFVSMFRSPMQRVISGFMHNYHDCKRLKIGTTYVDTNDRVRLSKYSEYERLHSYAKCVQGCAIQMLNGYRCGNHYDPPSQDQIDFAVDKVLNYYGFVGISEKFTQTISLWSKLFGVPITSYKGKKVLRKRNYDSKHLQDLYSKMNFTDPDIYVYRAAQEVWKRQKRLAEKSLFSTTQLEVLNGSSNAWNNSWRIVIVPGCV